MITREQAAAFIRALNAAQPYVPPILFAPLADGEIAQFILALANGADAATAYGMVATS